MKKISGTVVAVNAGTNDDLSKSPQQSIRIELDGIVGDTHGGYVRKCWQGDKQPQGTARRNERQWSAMSVEEIADISEALDLTEALDAATLGANLCIAGVPELSRLPKGSLLKFASGAELIVEEYNPPCLGMGKQIASRYETRSGKPLADTDFSKAAKLTRGIVGVVEAVGEVHAGDTVDVEVYETPSWLRRSAD
jgi:MOSC domain-containing protein YiiM